MKFRQLLFLMLLLPMLAAAENTGPDVAAVANVIDDFHDAAAHGDKERYLGHLTEHAVFMGTDEWERWPKHPDFIEYVDGRFKDGVGWNYKSVERTIRFGERPDIAWFDEVLYSETHGRFRGTGVLTRQSGQWQLEHYAMSFLILNENWEEVVELTKTTQTLKKSDQSLVEG